ncbi:MAG: hypothetical protein J7J65_03670 [Candidatus Korarchaeota archaeon]|nr:hypothetical protein [Candidatus Korarchaeota archaeon]
MNDIKCPLCGHYLSYEDGSLLCTHCGYIAGDVLVPSRSLKRYPLYVKHRYNSIEKVVRQLELPEEVIELAREIIHSYELITGKKAGMSLLIAAIILASRKCGLAIPIREVLLILHTKLSPSKVALAIGALKEVLPERENIPWEGYVNYLIRKIFRDERFRERLRKSSLKVPTHIIAERIRIRAIRELKNLNRRSLNLTGKNPVYIAAAVVYLASKKVGIRELSQSLMADVLGASRSVISKTLRNIR